MKTRPLPPTDLANIAVLRAEEQFERLMAKRDFVPPHSLEWTRRNLRVLMGAEGDLGLGLPILSFEELRKTARNTIKRSCDLTPNLKRCQAILEYSSKRRLVSREGVFGVHRVSADMSVAYAHSIVSFEGEQGFIPFFDLRKSGGLTSGARDFIFSMNFHLIIDADVDFADCGLRVIKYIDPVNASPFMRDEIFSGEPRYGYDELSAMIAQTYEIWSEVQDIRRRADRDQGTGTDGLI